LEPSVHRAEHFVADVGAEVGVDLGEMVEIDGEGSNASSASQHEADRFEQRTPVIDCGRRRRVGALECRRASDVEALAVFDPEVAQDVELGLRLDALGRDGRADLAREVFE